jgi:hypothetical protein
MNSREEKIEAVQREIAEKMGVPWERYATRAQQGVAVAGSLLRLPRRRWYLGFAWRPRVQPEPWAGNSPQWELDKQEEATQRDLAHNRSILASIPKVETPSPDGLSDFVARYQREANPVRFLSRRGVEVLGMRGYRPVFGPDGRPVMFGTLLMCETPQGKAGDAAMLFANGADEADEDEPKASGRGGHGDGDIFRITWDIWIWRGIFALYRYTPRGGGSLRRGLELVTERRGGDPKSVRLAFYPRP